MKNDFSWIILGFMYLRYCGWLWSMKTAWYHLTPFDLIPASMELWKNNNRIFYPRHVLLLRLRLLLLSRSSNTDGALSTLVVSYRRCWLASVWDAEGRDKRRDTTTWEWQRALYTCWDTHNVSSSTCELKNPCCDVICCRNTKIIWGRKSAQLSWKCRCWGLVFRI